VDLAQHPRGPHEGGCVVAGVYFVYSATVEEHYLTGQIPNTYPAYKRSAKMLVPFIL
jgi:protein-S-isoprenylcysteine O-methyltransferase Ste14